jgi:hypothetical protein
MRTTTPDYDQVSRGEPDPPHETDALKISVRIRTSTLLLAILIGLAFIHLDQSLKNT